MYLENTLGSFNSASRDLADYRCISSLQTTGVMVDC